MVTPTERPIAPSYLVRIMHGNPKAQVVNLKKREPKRVWRFSLGVCAVNESLSDALFAAQKLANQEIVH